VSQNADPLDELQKAIGYAFRDISLLNKALTHASLAGQGLWSYERLEFLGDAVAGLVVAARLFSAPERLNEGEMTAIRSDAVCGRSMAAAGERLGLSEHVRVDRGLARRQDYPPSVIADAYEALVGAIFLDGGFEKAREFVLRSLAQEIHEAEERRHPPSFKSILQELVQAAGFEPPTYRTLQQTGPDHDARFLAAVYVQEAEKGTGWGITKKDAEQKAAEDALATHHPDWRERLGRPGT
jgi:ribonuclease-3